MSRSNIRFFLLVAVIIVLQGCASPTQREIYFADGTKGYNINCSGREMNFSHCLEKAGEICNAKGYHILNQSGMIIPHSVAVHDFKKNPYSPTSGYATFPGSTMTRNVFIRCK
ncbi:MAG TPA: hypothetical protein PLV19_01220 [Nitrosomonas sp.]|nr:hypothetical protein [Nitrosomonas sp.]HQU97513.1 hypothetical protein [Nitrosomonas sp.]HQX12781.1 hypothetical protein [Nitrosomonas sp.]HRB32865.1 hypothetical protein [Nitrosomonas sp.]HRB45391.1 hypothetical protein [Nitrosomonas sp.]